MEFVGTNKERFRRSREQGKLGERKDRGKRTLSTWQTVIQIYVSETSGGKKNIVDREKRDRGSENSKKKQRWRKKRVVERVALLLVRFALTRSHSDVSRIPSVSRRGLK